MDDTAHKVSPFLTTYFIPGTTVGTGVDSSTAACIVGSGVTSGFTVCLAAQPIEKTTNEAAANTGNTFDNFMLSSSFKIFVLIEFPSFPRCTARISRFRQLMLLWLTCSSYLYGPRPRIRRKRSQVWRLPAYPILRRPKKWSRLSDCLPYMTGWKKQLPWPRQP